MESTGYEGWWPDFQKSQLTLDVYLGKIWQPDLEKGNIKCQLENQTQDKPSKPGQESSEITVQLVMICPSIRNTSSIFVANPTQIPAPGLGINMDFSTKLSLWEIQSDQRKCYDKVIHFSILDSYPWIRSIKLSSSSLALHTERKSFSQNKPQ